MTEKKRKKIIAELEKRTTKYKVAKALHVATSNYEKLATSRLISDANLSTLIVMLRDYLSDTEIIELLINIE